MSATVYTGLDFTSTPSTILSSPSEHTSEMNTTDSDCFDVDFAIEAIGSSATAIRSIIDRSGRTSPPTTHYIKFTNVPPKTADMKFSKACRQMYNSDNRVLIVTVLSGPHEVASRLIDRSLYNAITAANISNREYLPSGSDRVVGIRCSKEPDGSFYPNTSPPPGIQAWPTIVVEVGLSESKRKLRADAAWWIANSEGQVNVVITVSIHKSAAEVVFEAIVLVHPVPTLRNGRRQYASTVRQSIVVSRQPGGQNQLISTTPHTPLKISCEELLRRPAVPPETDPDILVRDLEEIAWLIWQRQKV